MITPHEIKPWFVASMNSKNASLQRISGTGYISTCESHKQIIKGIQKSSIPFTWHHLHRTFRTTAESLDIPAYAVKRLTNHKMNHDVTTG